LQNRNQPPNIIADRHADFSAKRRTHLVADAEGTAQENLCCRMAGD
jgi:hypothetical protein